MIIILKSHKNEKLIVKFEKLIVKLEKALETLLK